MGRGSSLSYYNPSQLDIFMVIVTRKPCLEFGRIQGRMDCELEESNCPLTLLFK